MNQPSRLAILLSGRGSNFTAIHEAIARGELNARIVAVVSNRSDAGGLDSARAWGYDAHAFDHRQFASREAHEAEILQTLERVHPDFVCLAGYMRRLSESFVEAWPERILNIHPSLLPAFPGISAQDQALAWGVRVSGCTVHFVDAGVDSGPIIVQRTVPLFDDDTAETLAARILVEEHRAYVEALTLVCSGNYRIEGRRVVRKGATS
jgi:phosphoribosylglycinamide formyltransferase 1